ncbi:MAG: type II asparaginase [Bacteroidales bacterium]
MKQMNIFRIVFFLILGATLLPRQNATAADVSITSTPQTSPQHKPNIKIIATGGTIAGVGSSAIKSSYEPGKIAIGSLLDAVPQVNDIANVTGEQLVNIGSEHMTDQVMLSLAKRINQFMDDNQTDGIVITHGTDTMEESAFFLSLTTKGTKPVILVGAMRPSTAMSADGPLNLYNAIVAASAPESAGKGVLVAMNGSLYPAEDVLKTHTINVEAFQAPNKGPEGYINNGKVCYYNKTDNSPISHIGNPEQALSFDISGLSSLPKVGIIYGHSNIDPDIIETMIQNGYKGIIYAGVGNGNIHKNVMPALDKARREGIVVVRSSRVPQGPTITEPDIYEGPHQLIASQYLNPQKSRILLMLSLTHTKNHTEIQRYFDKY